jgi:hypothetical protein
MWTSMRGLMTFGCWRGCTTRRIDDNSETASCGPYLRSRLLGLLDAALLRLQFHEACGLDLNHNQPFLYGQSSIVYHCNLLARSMFRIKPHGPS